MHGSVAKHCSRLCSHWNNPLQLHRPTLPRANLRIWHGSSYGNSKRFGEQKAFKTHKTALRQRSFEVLLEYQIAGVAKCFLMRLKQEGHQLFDGHIKSQKKTSVGYAQIISMFPRSSDSKNLKSRTTIN